MLGALRRAAACRLRRRSRPGQTAARRPHPRRQPELGQAAAAGGVFAREPVRRHAGTERRDCQPPGSGRARRRPEREHLGDARRRHTARHRGAARQRTDRAVPRHRRYALVQLAAVRHLRRNAQAHCCARRHHGAPPQTANAKTKNVHEVVPPSRMLDGFGSFVAPPPTARPVPADFSGSATRRSSAGLLWAAGRPHRRQRARRGRPADAARFRAAGHGEPRNLPHHRAAGSARTDFPRRARPSAARHACRAVPRRRYPAADPARFTGCHGIRDRDCRACAHARASARAGRDAKSGRAAVGARNQARLCRYRRCRGRCHQQGWPGRPDLFLAQRTALEPGDPIGLDIAPRRTCVLSADLLADRARRAATLRRGAQAHRHLHEGRRHRAVRYPRRRRRAARSGRRNPTARACSNCAKSFPRSIFPNSSRCRATTF